MFYFKYAGHQIPPKRIEVGIRLYLPVDSELMAVWEDFQKRAGKGRGNAYYHHGSNRGRKAGVADAGSGQRGLRGMGRVVCRAEPSRVSLRKVACAQSDNSDEILRHAEKKTQTPNPNAPAATAPAPSPASTALRPNPPALQRVNGAPGPRSPIGIASTSAPPHPASNLGATYRNNPNLRPATGPPGGGHAPSPGPSRSYPGHQQPMRPPPNGGGYDPRAVRGPPPGQHGQPGPQAPAPRNAYAASGRRF